MTRNIWDTTFNDSTGQPDVTTQPDAQSHYAQRPFEARQMAPQSEPDHRQAEYDKAAEHAEFERWKRSQQANQQPTAPQYAPPDNRSYQRAPNAPLYERSREPLQGKKTYLTAGAGIVLGALSLAGVDITGANMTTGESLSMIWNGGMFVFTRMGISKFFS